MTASLIDGIAIAAKVRSEVAVGVRKLLKDSGITPGLATVLVGDNVASQTYVRAKQKACVEVGIESFGHVLSSDATQNEIVGLLRDLNAAQKTNNFILCSIR